MNRRYSGRVCEGILVLAAVFLAGCSAKVPSATVTGKVTLDNAAVSAGSVLFLSDDGQGGSADLKADGTYMLQCRPGRFQVAVSPPPPLDPVLAGPGAAPSKPAAGIPRKYQEVATSGLATQLEEGNNTFDITLTSK